MWQRKNKKEKQLKSLIGFLSANKIEHYNGGGGEEKTERKKKSKCIYRTCQKIRIIKVFLESLLLESFPWLGATVNHSKP